MTGVWNWISVPRLILNQLRFFRPDLHYEGTLSLAFTERVLARSPTRAGGLTLLRPVVKAWEFDSRVPARSGSLERGNACHAATAASAYEHRWFTFRSCGLGLGRSFRTLANTSG